MKATDNSITVRQATPRRGWPVKRVWLILILLGAALVGALVISRGPPFTSDLRPAGSDPGRPAASESAEAPVPGSVRQVLPAPIPAPRAPVQPAPAAGAATNRDPRQLVAGLAGIGDVFGPITSEQAERFRQDVGELVRQGPASVPAISEYLARNLDIDFVGAPGGDLVSYASLRASLLDTLRQIGGAEAQAAMVQTLQTTALPAEILELAKDLEQEAPGLYREQILKAARESLEMAAANQLGNNVELGPAYRVLDAYGGGSDDLARTDPSVVFQAVLMANLPDGSGLPSLIRMAQDPNPRAWGQTIATEMIAQLAGQNGIALEALLQMARHDQISNRVWERLAPILGGDQYQIGGLSTAASQTEGSTEAAAERAYTIVNTVTTPDQIGQRIALIDKLLAIVSGNSAGAAALRHERGMLAEKLEKQLLGSAPAF